MTGDALADLLIGRAYSFSQMNQPTIYNGASAIQSGLYVQDQIKAARRLVLTLGLRWELDPIYKRDRGQEFARFVPSLYDRNTASQIDPTTGTIIGTPNNTDGIQVVDSAGDVSRLDFAPRISFAYSPWGNKTVLRAGYGIFYDHLPINTGSLLSNPPFVFSETVYNVPFDDASSGQPGAQYPPSLQSLSLPVKTPMSQKYSAGIQHEFSGLMAQVDYVGDFSTNEPNYGAWYGYDQQPFYLDINQPAPNAGVVAGTVALDSVRPFYGFGAIQATAFGINSRYNALQAQVRKSLSNGLFFQAAYTLSKFTRSGGNTDALNLAYDAGRSAYDRPQIFSLLGTYEPPLLKNSSSRAVRDLGYGWVFSTNFRALSGVPMGVWMPTDTVGIGHPVRANWAGHVSMPRTMAQWFDPTAFSAPAPLVFGNTPIDAIRGPGSLNFDMGLFRDFKIKGAGHHPSSI